jgi:hypothetical protein
MNKHEQEYIRSLINELDNKQECDKLLKGLLTSIVCKLQSETRAVGARIIPLLLTVSCFLPE